MEATIESVFQQECALCQPVASNHVMVTKLPRACCLVPKLHIREGAQGLVTSEQTHWLFSLQPVLLCPYLSGSLPFCSPCGQSGKWTISTGHSHRAHSPVGLSSQNTCGVCCAGVYFQIPLSAPSMGASCLRLSNMVTGTCGSKSPGVICVCVCVCVLVIHLCMTLFHPPDSSLPYSSD